MRKGSGKCYASNSCFIFNDILPWHGDDAVSLMSGKCLAWLCETGNLISWSKEQWDSWLDKKIRICSSFSLAGWGPEHVTCRSMLYSSGSAACRQAPMHSSYSNNSLSELPVITISINCHTISALEWTDCSQDYCPMVEGCCHILHSLERLHFKTMFNIEYVTTTKKR